MEPSDPFFIFLPILWLPIDSAYLHVMQEETFSPESWEKLAPYGMCAQLFNDRHKRTAMIKLFGQN